jgi:ATP-dependent DNA ligase
VTTLEQAGSFFDQCVADGYEGMMLKDPDDSYHWDKRVIGSTKVKPVFSDEFTILRANANNSTGQDLIEFVCLTSDSKEFKVVPAWPKNMRNICCTYLDRYQGEALTIEYRGLSKAGIPLHPVGITVRDYEE